MFNCWREGTVPAAWVHASAGEVTPVRRPAVRALCVPAAISQAFSHVSSERGLLAALTCAPPGPLPCFTKRHV